MKDSYHTYEEWKGWDTSDAKAPVYQKLYFERELKRAGIHPPGVLLEVGFGNGEMLRCAKDLGFQVSGVEILPTLVEKANAVGFDAECADIASPSFDPAEQEGMYDVILAFDVVEHLGVEAAICFLTNLARMLKEDGRILLRFPNGGSPAGLLLQNGDYTHQQAITESKLRQLACGTGLEILQYTNTIRKIDRRSRSWWIRPLLFGFRNVIECIFGYLYVGRRVPLDKSCVAVLKKRS